MQLLLPLNETLAAGWTAEVGLHIREERAMVRLASVIPNPGTTDDEVLAAELPANQGRGYVRLDSIAKNSRDFLALGSTGIEKAGALLASPEARPGGSLHIASTDCRLCPPIDWVISWKIYLYWSQLQRPL